MTQSAALKQILALSPHVRYAALYRNGKLSTACRENLAGASSSESDKYEEVIVNPTLMTLLRQRGEIDCGGVQHVLIRYGNFVQCIHPITGGHLSVAFETGVDYQPLVKRLQRWMKSHFNSRIN